jgi:predicted RNA-binding Zn-ribbon protein involved in translation (DUF1610 family)
MELPSQKLKSVPSLQEPQLKSVASKPIQATKPKVEELSVVKEKPMQEPTHPKPIEEVIAKTEEVQTSVESKVGLSDEETTRKWQCPNCGNKNKSQIRELDDKHRPIWGNFYAKKYICGQCGKEWR